MSYGKEKAAKHLGTRRKKNPDDFARDEQDVLVALKHRISDWQATEPFSDESKAEQQRILDYLRNQVPKKLDTHYSAGE